MASTGSADYGSTSRRIIKNSAVPMATSLINKGLDLGLAVVMFRALGPDGVGQLTWTVLVVGYFDILINFGLGVLITRDVARDPAAAGRYLGGALLVRGLFALVAVCVAFAIAAPLAGPLGLTPEMGIALLVFTVGVGVSNLAGLASAWFSARERFEYPALVTVFTTAAKVTLGVAALQLGYGIIGLAGVSVIVNVATAIVLIALLVGVLGRPQLAVDVRFSLGLIGLSAALMLNNLLATIFFRVDGLILRGISGDEALGWYAAAYRFIDGLNLIPSSLTLALFPMLARLGAATETGERQGNELPAGDSALEDLPPTNLARTTEFALKALLTLAMPTAVGTTILADPIVRLIAGESFLPHAALALQTLIWFIPFSYTNGLLQYALISVNQQRFVTFAFIIAVLFNISLNLVAVPRWGYLAAAAATVLSEVVLLGPFLLATGRFVGPVRPLALAWRPALAAFAMAPVVWLTRDVLVLAVPLGMASFALVLVLVGGIDATDRRVLRATLRVKR